VEELTAEVTEQWRGRIRRARINAAITLVTSSVLSGLGGAWLADKMALRSGADPALLTIAAHAAFWGVAVGCMFTDWNELEVGILDVWAVERKHVIVRSLSMLLPWVTTGVVTAIALLICWGAGALTRWIFGRFIGFYVAAWAWSILAALFVWDSLDLGLVPEPLDRADVYSTEFSEKMD
jgi:hypothetical protein